MSQRVLKRVIVACALISVAFMILWFVGQEVSVDPTLDVPQAVANIYPGSWAPGVRGVFWLFIGATAVAFDLVIVYPKARSTGGRAAAIAAASITGLAFTTFAIGTFAGAWWSVIH